VGARDRRDGGAATEQGGTPYFHGAGRPGSAGAGVRWSAIAVLGRQSFQIFTALTLARLLGPESYGVISAATVYVTLTTLVMDQGLAAALVQRPHLARHTPGAVATVNLLTAVVLAAVTWLVAPAVAAFFDAERLTGLLRALAIGVLLKGLAIVPRAMRLRAMQFRTIAVADVGGGAAGAVAGITAALFGAGTWAMAWQVIATDVVVTLVLSVGGGAWRPNLHLREAAVVMPFGLRVFGSNCLAFASRNLDNILVGRVLGVTALSYYAMAYRVLAIPVQMVGQTVQRVTFPLLSRIAGDRDRLRDTVVRVTELLAIAAVPPMVLVAVASPQLVGVLLGPAWTPAVPVLAVLAIAGARETVFQVTGTLMKAMGRGRLLLGYEVGALVVQLTGIVVGVQIGVVAVAVGLTAAGLLLTPVQLAIQRSLAGVGIGSQLLTVAPALHVSGWGAAAYVLVSHTGWPDLAVLMVGSVAYAVTAIVVLRLAHVEVLRRTTGAVRGIVTAR